LRRRRRRRRGTGCGIYGCHVFLPGIAWVV